MIKTPEATRILVTGGAGFVGTAIVTAILEKHPDWKVTVIDLRPGDEWESPSSAVNYEQVDIRKSEECYNVVSMCDPHVIVHTAGIVPGINVRYGRNPLVQHNVNKVNVQGTENMIEAAKDNHTPNFLFTSSCTVLTDDLDHDYHNFKEDLPYPKSSLMYGESKALAEKIVMAAHGEQMSCCALRPSVILGREDYQLIPSIHSCIASGETKYQIGNADNLYDFTFIDNVADAHVLAIENLLSTRTAAGQVILISNDQPVTFRDFMLAVWAQFGHVPSFTIRVPGSLAWAVGFLEECRTWATGVAKPLSRGSVKDAIGTRYASQSKAKEILGYRPKVPIWDGIKISCDAYKLKLKAAKQ